MRRFVVAGRACIKSVKRHKTGAEELTVCIGDAGRSPSALRHRCMRRVGGLFRFYARWRRAGRRAGSESDRRRDLPASESSPAKAECFGPGRPSRGRGHRRRITRAGAQRALFPGRGKFFELAIYRAPRLFHDVHARSKPSKRRNQAPHPKTRQRDPVHLDFRVVSDDRRLCLHEAPSGVIAKEILPPPPGDNKTQLLCQQAELRLRYLIFGRYASY